MKYSLYLALLLLSPLFGRENPFFPSDESKKLKVTSNVSDARPMMGTVKYTFPDQARVLKEVTFTIQNLDGSIEEKSIQIDQSIDWHKSLLLTQGGSSGQSTATNSSSAANFGFVQMYSRGKTLTIKSSDPMDRHFALSDPNRIVIDFKHAASFNAAQKALNAAPYLNAAITNHGKFARVTITLDGRYAYTLGKENGLITVTCK